MLEVEIFDVWGIPSFGNLYILLAIGYVSKWVEAIATPKNEVKTMVRFVHKNIFTCFGAQGQSLAMKELTFSMECLLP